MRSEEETNRAIERYSDMISRICLVHLKNRTDMEDVFQTVFLKYLLYEESFENEEHEKAWMIRVTINTCKDFLKNLFKRKTLPLNELISESVHVSQDHQEVLYAVLSLPPKYKDVIYLHYYEGYTALEIGRLLNKKENTVYSLLKRGREQLKEILGGDDL